MLYRALKCKFLKFYVKLLNKSGVQHLFWVFCHSYHFLLFNNWDTLWPLVDSFGSILNEYFKHTFLTICLIIFNINSVATVSLFSHYSSSTFHAQFKVLFTLVYLWAKQCFLLKFFFHLLRLCSFPLQFVAFRNKTFKYFSFLARKVLSLYLYFRWLNLKLWHLFRN